MGVGLGDGIRRYRTPEEVDREYRSTIEAAIDRITNKRYANTFVRIGGFFSETFRQEIYDRGFRLELQAFNEKLGCTYLLSPLLRD